MDRKMNYMSVKEFVNEGYLQELNRRFLHPLGLAIVCSHDKVSDRFEFTGVWDSREDPEGIIFNSEIVTSEICFDRALKIAKEMVTKKQNRESLLGYNIQPFATAHKKTLTQSLEES